jgi:hypothetical protein
MFPMSEDNKSDAQAEEQQQAAEPKKPAAKKVEEPVKKQPDVVDEEELDIEIERVSPKRGSSCGPVAWILFILVLALVAVFGGMKVSKERAEAAEKARQLREATYQAQQETINGNIEKASKAATRGDVEAALSELEKAQAKWTEMASTANSANDQDRAQFAMERGSDLKAVLEELGQYRDQAADLQARADKLADEVDGLEKERDEFNSKVSARVLEIATSGDAGATAGTAAKPEAEAKPAAGAKAKKAEPAEKDEDEASACEAGAKALLSADEPKAKPEAKAKDEAKEEAKDEAKPEAKKVTKKATKKAKKPVKKAEEPEAAAKPSAEPETPASAEPPNEISAKR